MGGWKGFIDGIYQQVCYFIVKDHRTPIANNIVWRHTWVIRQQTLLTPNMANVKIQLEQRTLTTQEEPTTIRHIYPLQRFNDRLCFDVAFTITTVACLKRVLDDGYVAFVALSIKQKLLCKEFFDQFLLGLCQLLLKECFWERIWKPLGCAASTC